MTEEEISRLFYAAIAGDGQARDRVLRLAKRALASATDFLATETEDAEGQPMNIGLRAAREQAGLSQRALGEQVGVSASTVGRWEREGKVPDAETRAKVAEVLGLDPWAGEP